jgi:leucyl aminopeptidase
MKSDMAGAAMVVGAIKALSVLNIPVHVIGLIPATDNRPGGNAYAPGDIITMYNKSTVEVLNTDAEGRMILADALSYADKFDPELVISAATLTGAAVRAIGTKAAISMGNAPKNVMDSLVDSGLKTHERLVEFPFWEEYLTPMKSEIADLKNIGGADAGMITAGKFLETFVKAPYIHLDVAGPTWLEQRSGYLPKGGTGFGVRLLLEFLTNYHQWKKNEN